MAQPCYFLDGSDAVLDGIKYSPCDSSAGTSSCCAENASCLDNNLCLRAGVISRPACTDKSWAQESQCLSICKDVHRNGSVALIPCKTTGNSFACQLSSNGGDCEAHSFNVPNGSGFKLRVAQVSGLGISTAVNISPTQAISDVLSIPATQSGSCKSSTCVASSVPIGVGIGVGVPLMLCSLTLGYLLWRERRKQRPLLFAATTSTKSATADATDKPYGLSDQPSAWRTDDGVSMLPPKQGLELRQELEPLGLQELQTTPIPTHELEVQRRMAEAP